MRTTFTFLLLLMLGNCFSQQNFLVNEGSLNSNEEFLSATQTTDKNYVAVGYTTISSTDSNVHLVKVSRNGILLWTKTIAGGGHDVAIGVISTTDGGFAISGTLHDKMALLKFDSLGNLLWNKQYDELKGSIGRSIVQTSDGYLMAGGITSDGNFDSSIAYIIKTDESGNVLWSKKYFTASAYSIINDLKPTKDGNYVFLSDNKKSNDSAWVVKIDPSGNVLWAKYFFDAVSKTSGYSILPTIDAGYLVSGTRTNLSNNGFLLKLSPAGAKIWSKTTNTDGIADIVFHSSVSGVDGGYATLGSAITPDSSFYYLLKADEAGGLQFTKTLKKVTDDNKGTFYSAITSASDGYLAVGSVRDVSGFLDGTLLRLDLNYSSCKPSTGTYGTIIDYGTLNTGQITPASGSTVVTIDNVTLSVTGVQTLVCTALPLNLISFDATLQKKSVLLQWKTAQEVNTAYFNVEKSQDGKMFTAFKQVSAAGNASGVSSYSITDAQPFAGESWYRLKMVDKDGQYVYSNAIAINNLLQKTIAINPNPVAGILNLNVQSLTAGNATIVISDVNGKLLLQKTITISSGSNVIPVAIDHLAKGMYIMKFVQDNYTENLKWIKQ